MKPQKFTTEATEKKNFRFFNFKKAFATESTE